jgi:translocator protein
MHRDALTHGPSKGKLALAIVLGIAVVAGLGGAFTDIGPWYRTLKQPAWKPPDAWFGPIWTTIYVLTGTAIWRTWRATTVKNEKPLRRALLLALAANGALNVAWSVLFFTLQRPDWALIEVIALGLSVLLLIVLVARVDTLSAVLLAPYAAWVGVATTLNATVVKLNGPF